MGGGTEASRASAAPRYALATGAGKDATLALHRARAAGLRVDVGFNLYDAATRRVAFHGTRMEVVRSHLEALGLEPLLEPVPSGAFEPTFLRVLDSLVDRGVDGVIFGNLHLADVRAWYEERTTAAGLLHREPLWGEDPGRLVREGIDLGYRAVVVSVDLAAGDGDWVGRELTRDLVEAIEARGCDPCGERGEYHTFVRDGPEFRRSLSVHTGEVVETNGHRLVDLTLGGP